MTKKVSFIFFATSLIVLISIFSCTDCGPFADKYKLKKIILDVSELGFDEASKTLSGPGAIVSDSMSFDSLDINLFFQSEHFFSVVSPAFEFFPSLNACSPPDPTTDEVITGMKIFTQVSFDANHSAGSSLVDLFDVIVDNAAESIRFEKVDLGAYLSTNPKVPNELHLRLKTPPAQSREYEFTIEYTQDGIDVSALTLQTEKVLIHN